MIHRRTGIGHLQLIHQIVWPDKEALTAILPPLQEPATLSIRNPTRPIPFPLVLMLPAPLPARSIPLLRRLRLVPRFQATSSSRQMLRATRVLLAFNSSWTG